MTESSAHRTRHTAFVGHRLIASGSVLDVALAARAALTVDPSCWPLVFSDATGRPVDLDLRGNESEVSARYAPTPQPDDAGNSPSAADEPAPRGRGRPRLGVVAREVTLLPEHWDWLARQPGGASVALRKLVHQARRDGAADEARARARERCHAFMTAVGGDLPGFEDAIRALFAGDGAGLADAIGHWPADVREQALHLATPTAPPPDRG